jgi:hypothetical protein
MADAQALSGLLSLFDHLALDEHLEYNRMGNHQLSDALRVTTSPR